MINLVVFGISSPERLADHTVRAGIWRWYCRRGSEPSDFSTRPARCISVVSDPRTRWCRPVQSGVSWPSGNCWMNSSAQASLQAWIISSSVACSLPPAQVILDRPGKQDVFLQYHRDALLRSESDHNPEHRLRRREPSLAGISTTAGSNSSASTYWNRSAPGCQSFLPP